MRKLFRILFFPYYGRSIPSKWLGKWIDGNGRQLIIAKRQEHNLLNHYQITILDKNSIPFKINLPDEKTKDTLNLHGELTIDINGKRNLQVEAGMHGLGPTFLTKDKLDKYTPANRWTPISRLQIIPNVTIGLYDDWEDDLGVPWAYPLLPFDKT